MQLQGSLANNFDLITNIINKEIPEQSKNLSDNVINLEKVAQYCEDIYVNSKEHEKQHLLNETKSYTAQALASVAYQIHVLSNNFLSLLDSQSAVLDDMSVSIHHLAHEVSIHKEKVARREIGILTTNKCIVRTAKVKRPEIEEKPVKYIRKPIDYSLLDDVGHGVKLARQASDQLSKIGVGRQNSYSSTHSSSGVAGPISSKPMPDANTPPLMLKANTIMSVNSGNGLSTVRSTASTASSYHYRTPVIPPSVPSEYLSRQELGIYSSKKELNQSAGAESLSGAYGGTISYRRPSQNSSNLNNTSLNTGNQNTSEYSETIDRRMGNNYLQQLNNYSSINNNNSVGYASGKEIGIIRTNLNNIDYATNGTIYRRPQLHSSVYERSISGSSHVGEHPNNYSQQSAQQQQQMHKMQPIYNRSDSQRSGSTMGANITNQYNNNNNSSILSNTSSLHGLLPPPPPILFSSNTNIGLRNNPESSSLNNGDPNLENIVFENEFLAGNNVFDEEDDDELIPNWVPIDRCIEKVITLFDYDGLRDDELSFKENMFIYVIKKNDDHWYEGIMKTENGDIVQGLYPYNYAKCVKRYVEDSRVTQC